MPKTRQRLHPMILIAPASTLPHDSLVFVLISLHVFVLWQAALTLISDKLAFAIDIKFGAKAILTLTLVLFCLNNQCN